MNLHKKTLLLVEGQGKIGIEEEFVLGRELVTRAPLFASVL